MKNYFSQEFLKSRLSLVLNHMDIIIAGLLFLGAAVIFALSYLKDLGQYGMGIAFLLAPAIYLIIKREYLSVTDLKKNLFAMMNDRSLRILDIAFFSLYIISILILHFTLYSLPWYYFLVISIALVILIVQALSIEYNFKNIFIFFVKLILISLSWRAGRFFALPSLPGNDIHFHLLIVKYIVDYGHVAPFSLADKYSFTPFFHIYDATLMMVTSITDIISSLFLLASFAIIAITVFTYIIGTKLFDFRVGLIAAVFVNISEMMFVKTVTNIDTSILVMIYFLVLILCFLYTSRVFYCLTVLMIICINYTHQLSAFCVFLAIVAYSLCTLLYNHTIFSQFIPTPQSNRSTGGKVKTFPFPTLVFTIFVFIFMVFFWTQIIPDTASSDPESAGFFGKMMNRLDMTSDKMITQYASTGEVSTSYGQLFSTFDTINTILYNFGYCLLFSLALLGTLFVLKYCFTQEKISLLVSMAALFCVIYLGTYLGLNQLFIPHRFLPFLQLIFIPLSAFAVILLFNISSNRSWHIIFTIFVFVMIFLLVTTPYINRNSLLYAQKLESRDQYMQSEIDGIFWGQQYSPDGSITVDPIITLRGVSTIQTKKIQDDKINHYNLYSRQSGNIYVRNFISEKQTVKLIATYGYNRVRDYSGYLKALTTGSSLVYSNNQVKIFNS